VDGVLLTATSWTVPIAGGNLSAGRLFQWNTYGLGVCSNADTPDPDCGIPSHSLDNQTDYDFVLFQFSVPVRLVSMVVDPYAPGEPGSPPADPTILITSGGTTYHHDRDVTYYTRNGGGTPALSGVSLAGLTSSLGFTRTDKDNTGSYAALSINLNNVVVTSLLFGSRVGGDPNLDFFKGNILTVEAVPEPGTFALLGAGLLALGVASRRVRK
jgi:hypothetical protein